MSPEKIIRFWKDEGYRLALSELDQSTAGENPAGLIELSDQDLGGVDGAVFTFDSICGAVSLSLAVSMFLECKDSILHGTCSAFSVGCCPG